MHENLVSGHQRLSLIQPVLELLGRDPMRLIGVRKSIGQNVLIVRIVRVTKMKQKSGDLSLFRFRERRQFLFYLIDAHVGDHTQPEGEVKESLCPNQAIVPGIEDGGRCRIKPAHQIVERPVLHHQNDDVLDFWRGLPMGRARIRSISFIPAATPSTQDSTQGPVEPGLLARATESA